MRGRFSVGAIALLATSTLAACGGSSAPATDSASTSGNATTESGARILRFGKSTAKAEADAAATNVAAFFSDREDGFWPAACSYLSVGMRNRTQQVGGSGQCGKGVRALTTEASKAAGEAHIVSVEDLRRDGNRGFLIYTTRAQNTKAMRMVLEKGRWRLDAVNPTPLFS